MPRCVIVNDDCRNMSRIGDNEIDLIITSPPYWNLKDYGHSMQIGFGQSLEDYYASLLQVWNECYRVLKNGKFIAINIGDVFHVNEKTKIYSIIPLHAVIIQQLMSINFIHLGTIIWHKLAKSNISGGGRLPGSYPYPYNGRILFNHEYIMIFQKPGKQEKKDETTKELSKLTIDEWKIYFNSVWQVKNNKMKDHIATFPEEIPYRLIKMYSFVNETVLDPFGGIGTTCKAALKLGRNCIMYEINSQYAKKSFIDMKSDMFMGNEVVLLEHLQEVNNSNKALNI